MGAINEAFRQARRTVRVSQRLVAEMTEVSRPTVSAIERKGREPRISELVRVASLFRVRPDILISGDFSKHLQEVALQASYRAPGGRELDAHERWELVELAGAIPESRPCEGEEPVRGGNAVTVSNAVKKWLALDDAPPVDIFRALYEKGYGLEFTAFSNMSGALLRRESGDGCLIIVNSDQPDDRQRWSAVHEFAHLVAGHHAQVPEHVDEFGPARLPEDEEADLVAALVLMPGERVRQAILELPSPSLSPEAMYGLADQFHVSYTAMVLRCGTLGFISSAQVAELRKAKPTRIEAELGLKARRAHAFAADAALPPLVDSLVASGDLPPDWATDFSENGRHHVRRLQSEAVRQYVTSTPIRDRRTSVTELFESVAQWVAETYPWRTV